MTTQSKKKAARPQRVRWSDTSGSGPGIYALAENESVEEFIDWDTLHAELKEHLLPILFADPAGYDFVLADHHGKKNWLLFVIDKSGERYCSGWFGNAPDRGWAWDGLVRFGNADDSEPVWQTYQRYSDGTYRRLPSKYRSLDARERLEVMGAQT
jgi:hypothetical protein